MIVMRDMQPGDLDGYREGDYTGWGSVPINLHRTLSENGQVLAVVGVTERWLGVGEVWAVFTEAARGRGVGLLRWCRFLLDSVQNETTMRRLNIWVRSDRPEYIRWAKLCGFEPETFLEGGGPNNVNIIGLVRWRDRSSRSSVVEMKDHRVRQKRSSRASDSPTPSSTGRTIRPDSSSWGRREKVH